MEDRLQLPRIAVRTLMAIAFLLPQARVVAAGDAGVKVAEARWAAKVSDRELQGSGYDSAAPGPPLFLWMRLHGSSAALAELRRAGKLPIRHEWYQWIGTRADGQGSVELVDAVNLSVGRDEKIAELDLELKTRGFFDWRTWSMKENIEPGFWSVRMMYADETPVRCDPPFADDDGDCEFSIRVGD